MEKQHKATIVGGRWHYQPQEQDGDYWFDGMVIVTATIKAEIPEAELQAIIIFLRELAQQKKGLDYLQRFKLEDGTKIYIIENLSRSQSAIYALEYHYCTILYPFEY